MVSVWVSMFELLYAAAVCRMCRYVTHEFGWGLMCATWRFTGAKFWKNLHQVHGVPGAAAVARRPAIGTVATPPGDTTLARCPSVEPGGGGGWHQLHTGSIVMGRCTGGSCAPDPDLALKLLSGKPGATLWNCRRRQVREPQVRLARTSPPAPARPPQRSAPAAAPITLCDRSGAAAITLHHQYN